MPTHTDYIALSVCSLSDYAYIQVDGKKEYIKADRNKKLLYLELSYQYICDKVIVHGQFNDELVHQYYWEHHLLQASEIKHTSLG